MFSTFIKQPRRHTMTPELDALLTLGAGLSILAMATLGALALPWSNAELSEVLRTGRALRTLPVVLLHLLTDSAEAAIQGMIMVPPVRLLHSPAFESLHGRPSPVLAARSGGRKVPT